MDVDDEFDVVDAARVRLDGLGYMEEAGEILIATRPFQFRLDTRAPLGP